ncbi:aldehyde dehydrogenase [Segetibacter aerophilus]|uniref:Aldehyde dehydrogenase n=1 Tax=Segetibacter aerophilus TaxID=670293 RepID=A0A512BF94_9BACT|nr:aldehyde dehydrogenase [Segetibacter aerophilus]GEO10507.1 aldehyde dehydrogenase [Segetibacter aerophilus]
MTTYTSTDFDTMRNYFFSGATVEYTFRKQQLQVLKKGIQKYEQQIMDALFKDLHKSAEEAFTTEIGFIYAEISHTLKNLQKWMRKSSVSTPLFLLPSSSSIIREPLGVCLIIAPWNYPFQLLIAPLIGAIAGGNCAVLKPSEMAVNTSVVVSEMIAEFFDKKYISVVEGDGAIVVPALMTENRFDHVFFTGSIPVGREIAKLAAEKLVPVTLELGGKSPCIIDGDADLKVAAKRIVWGKFTNAGQTCVAPDYLLVHEKNKDEVIKEMQLSIERFYGKEPIKSNDYGRIINRKRVDKLKSYLQQGEVVSGGHVREEELYFSPTLMEQIAPEAPLMKEEIFGPILPIITFKEQDEALAVIHKNSHPLSLYYFGNNKKNEDYFINNVQFGGGCVNNTLVHLANADLPFGGVGNSGVGAYHGKFSFETFTRAKAILKTATWVDPDVKYPPYKGKLKLLRWFFK